MTERGLPIVGGAPACPFVAFVDDRDERATSPDHRHRCYAEAEPATRALAHQEAYCLSSAFPVCPTFQDWARREAARARPPDVPPERPDEDGEEDEYLPPLISDRPPRRGSRATWSAPPPWLSGSPSGPGTAPQGPAAGQPTGPDMDAPEFSGSGPGPAAGAAGAAAAGGLSGSFADRLASDRAPEDEAWGDERAARAPGAADRSRQLDEDEDEGYATAPPRQRERFDAGHEQASGGPEADARDGAAPSWERPRRLEAYPTLRSQRLSSALASPILLGIAALVLAALALFVLPSLLGSLGGGPGGSPSPGTAASAAASGASFEPTLEPLATPGIYTVQQGDTLTKIAIKFGVTLTALIDANRATHPNPDLLKVGDQLIIPTAVPSELPGASSSTAP